MAKQVGVCTAEMTEYLKWRGLPSLSQYIHSQFRCEQAYKHIAEAQQSQFENKEALKKASSIFFDLLRQEPCIQGYVGLAYLFLLLNQGENAIKYLAAAQEINPHDPDTVKLLEFVLKEDPDLKRYIHPPSFKDDEENFVNYLDDHLSVGNINHLEEIPSELLVQIFSWLKPKSVAKFREVNKHYRDLLVDNIYWQDLCATRWIPITTEDIKRFFKGMPNNECYYKYYQTNHNVMVNWLNRSTKFEEIKELKGEAVELYPNICCGDKIFALHLNQPISDKTTRSIEFFRSKSGNIHRIKRLHVDIGFTENSSLTSMSTSTADHIITYADNGTVVFSDMNKRESKSHQIGGHINAISGLPASKGVKFLAGSKERVSYYDGVDITTEVTVCDQNGRIASISTQHDEKAAILVTGTDPNICVKILDVATMSVVDTLATTPHVTVQWMDSMHDVFVGFDKNVTFYDIRSKNKFIVPKVKPFEQNICTSLAMDDTKMFIQSRVLDRNAGVQTSLILFDCRYSSSIVDIVQLPQQNTVVRGLGLWGLQKLVYARNHHLVEWDLCQTIKPVNNSDI